MNTEITLVSLFFDIGRETWGLYPRKTQDYIESFKIFLKYDYKMVVFVDDRYYDQLKEFNDDKKLLIPINKEWLFENLWAFSKYERECEIMNSDYYTKLVKHRIDLNYPENTNPLYTILTHSKIDVVNYVIENNLSQTEYFAWVDFGYFYDKTSKDFLPTGSLDITKFDLEKINLCLINPITDRDSDILYTLKYAPEIIGAYFFFGNRSVLKQFQLLCHDALVQFQKIGIADDEQGLWLQIYFQFEHLFKLHVFGKWHQALKYFSLEAK